MSLKDKRLVIIDSPENNDYAKTVAEIAERKYRVKLTLLLHQFPIPSVQQIISCDAAFIHFPKNTTEQQLYMELFEKLLAMNFPFIVVFSMISHNDGLLIKQFVEKKYTVLDKWDPIIGLLQSLDKLVGDKKN